MRMQLIMELVEKFYSHQITLREIIMDLDAEEMDEFIDSYDEFVKDGSHNAP